MKTKILVLILLACFVPYNSISGQKAGKKIVLSGNVKDIKGNPVNGAMIFIDNKNTRVSTDNSGSFRVKVKPDAKNISAISVSGGKGISLIEGKTIVDIVLTGSVAPSQTQEKAVSEDDVNIGYGTVSKKNLTSSVSKIDATNNRFAGYNNIYDLIRGQCPGVNVNGKSITIRGVNTIMGSTDPLFVVDGIVVNSLDFINPQEVRSIEVLKDSSAAIYGSRGSNGVIMISLKGTERPGK